jgi:uncharacterized protein with ParB-like and HNH nuclease domain
VAGKPNIKNTLKEKTDMSKYFSKPIKDVIKEIRDGKIYLPAIQRKFVWNYGKIEALFDSIMCDYPIGTFLFWDIERDNFNKFTFYKFIQEYDDRNPKNEKRPVPELNETLVGVLDGQQRLNSMYIALQGSYTYKTPHARRDSAGKHCRLWLNLLYQPAPDSETSYQFKFLTDAEAEKVSETELWFLVKKVLEWGDHSQSDEVFDAYLDSLPDMQSILRRDRTRIKSTLTRLWQRLTRDDYISYFSVKTQELDEVAEIFQRVNGQGIPLSKSDLLFSIIVAHWETGRDEMDTLIAEINAIGDRFNFNIDNIMKACLCLIDVNIQTKIANFTRENIDRVINNWPSIQKAFTDTVILLRDFGFNSQNLLSANAVLPITYYLYKGGELTDAAKSELRLYLISALLSNTLGASGDSTIAQLREAMRQFVEPTKKPFSFKEFAHTFEHHTRKTIVLDSRKIEEIIDTENKGAKTFMLLSLLYPNLRYGECKFHQDHIHPKALFADGEYARLNLDMEAAKTRADWRDKMPNLQLLEGVANEQKSMTPFKKWLNDLADGGENPVIYKQTHHIDPAMSEDFADFEEFYVRRRNELLVALKNALGVA